MLRNTTTGEIQSFVASDGTKLAYRCWRRPSPKAVCLCLAGVESHGGWYEGSSSALAKRGIAVYFLDRRGSGLSQGARGDLRHVKDLYHDIHTFLTYLRGEHQDCPIFLLTISWAGKLGFSFCLKYPTAVDALALVTPGLATLADYSLKDKLAIFFSALFAPDNLFEVPIPNAHYFTNDPEYVAFIENDELCIRKISARFCIQTWLLDRSNRWNRRSLTLPVGLFLAGNDRIINNDGVKRILEGTDPDLKDVYYYRDASHTLEFDIAKEHYVHDLGTWMENFCSKGGET